MSEATPDGRIDPDDLEAVATAAEKWGPPPEGIQWRLLLRERDALRDERDRLRDSIRNMADNNSPHDAQRIAQMYADRWAQEAAADV